MNLPEHGAAATGTGIRASSMGFVGFAGESPGGFTYFFGDMRVIQRQQECARGALGDCDLALNPIIPR